MDDMTLKSNIPRTYEITTWIFFSYTLSIMLQIEKKLVEAASDVRRIISEMR